VWDSESSAGRRLPSEAERHVARMSRFPKSVYRHGTEPDVRFSLANERTFLAWIRTGLALIAGGVALELLGVDLQSSFRLAAALVLIVAGILTPAFGWIGWMRGERAMRLQEPLPGSPLGPVVAAAVSLAGILVLLGVLLR
jgi:putative membrane protein